MKKNIELIINHRFTERFIIIMVILNIIVFNFGAEDFFTNGWYVQAFDIFSMVVFTFEYIFRASIVSKIKDIFKPMLLLDFFVLLPYYLAFLPFKTTFLKLLSGYSDFYPITTFGRIADSLSVIICAGVHGLIMDLFVPAFIKFRDKAKNPA